MAATTALCTSFKQELMEAKHNFLLTGGNTFNIALFDDAIAGTFGAATTNYSNMGADEHAATGTYVARGIALTRIDPASSGTTAYADFADAQWASSTISSAGCLIFNVTDSDSAVYVGDFGSVYSSTGGNFDVVFPAADASNAIIRLA